MTIASHVERLDYGAADGGLMGGASTDKIGFYGTTPVVQAATIASVTTTAATSINDLGDTLTYVASGGVNAVFKMGEQFLKGLNKSVGD